jgi:hypothetical protein
MREDTSSSVSLYFQRRCYSSRHEERVCDTLWLSIALVIANSIAKL